MAIVVGGGTAGGRRLSIKLLFDCRDVLWESQVVPLHGFPISLFPPTMVVVVMMMMLLWEVMMVLP